MTMLSDQMDAARVSAGDPTDGLLERLAEMVGAKAKVNTVFGDPIRQGDMTVVPVAKVRWGFGGGGGRSEATQTGPAAGSGSGVGGGVSADPVGYLEIGPTGTSFRRISNPYPNPLFLLAAALATGIVLRSLARLLGR
jgi:uncharacterized spore protein YtfJ